MCGRLAYLTSEPKNHATRRYRNPPDCFFLLCGRPRGELHTEVISWTITFTG